MNRGLMCDVGGWRVALVCLSLVGCGVDTVDGGPPLTPGASGLAAEGWETVANQYQTFTLDKPSTVRFGQGDSESALSPACASFYAPDFALTSTRQASPIPTV